MNIFRIKPAAAALLLAGIACAFPAMAQTASASASQLTWQLIDLNPADGIAPSISFFDSRYNTEASYWLMPNTSDSRTLTTEGTNTLANDRVNVSATSQLNAANASAALTDIGDGKARGHYSTSFRLTPYTGVLFSLVAEVDGATSHPDGNFGMSSVTFRGEAGSTYGETGVSLFDDVIQTDNDAISTRLRGYVHSDAGDTQGLLSIDSFAEARKWDPVPTSPVPEPASAAMLLAGLGVVGAIAARRRRA